MNIETKSVRGNYDEYLKFGWEHTQDSPARSGRSHYTAHILARDKDMENHRLIETLEKKYFYLKSQIKTYSPITDSPENFLLILLSRWFLPRDFLFLPHGNNFHKNNLANL